MVAASCLLYANKRDCIGPNCREGEEGECGGNVDLVSDIMYFWSHRVSGPCAPFAHIDRHTAHGSAFRNGLATMIGCSPHGSDKQWQRLVQANSMVLVRGRLVYGGLSSTVPVLQTTPVPGGSLSVRLFALLRSQT